MAIDEILAMASRISWSTVLRPSLTPLGFFSTAPIGRLVRSEFPVLNIEEMPIPFAAVACDFAEGRELVFTEGDAAFAIRASCAVPGVFAPMTDAEGRLLVDGGVVSPTPVDAVKTLGAEIVIAVDLMACGASFRSRPRSALGMMLGSAKRLLSVAAGTQSAGADVMIVPQISHLRPDQIDKREEFIALGESAALAIMPKIKELCR
jgi:NTE family protein